MNVVYIFLDVDGVLNNEAVRKNNSNDMRIIDDENLKNFVELINRIDRKCLIILTSSWRYCYDSITILKNALNKYHLSIYDCLDGSDKKRNQLIIEYCMQRRIGYDDILILDDMVMDELSNRLVKCDFNRGLTINEVWYALSIVNN